MYQERKKGILRVVSGKEERNTENCIRKGRKEDTELCQEGKKETFLIDISSMAP